ncbi:unnamed protein product [Nyctereutes procyonoides]|uniref:(raccoon dog) hypothetical protein n=1 Tax=Nyctereutes procyonoides TaxID=34880 RepID=A0A811YXU5_NYCPR|nr:unnamed protein product [Nyctereutes procyonoides]
MVGEAPGGELDSVAKHESKEEKIFQKSKMKIRDCTYLISGENISQRKDIPYCPCGVNRIFEFQADRLAGVLIVVSWLTSPELKAIDWGLATQKNMFGSKI